MILLVLDIGLGAAHLMSFKLSFLFYEKVMIVSTIEEQKEYFGLCGIEMMSKLPVHVCSSCCFSGHL